MAHPDVIQTDPETRIDEFFTSFGAIQNSSDILALLTNYGLSTASFTSDNGVRQSIDHLRVLLGVSGQEVQLLIGFLLTQIPYSKLPQDLQGELQPMQSLANHSILPWYKSWLLCDAEDRNMAASLKSQLITAVADPFGEPFLVMKYVVWPTALCFRTTVTASGAVFVAGNYYSPVSEALRSELFDATDNGNPTLSPHSESPTWALMRTARQTPRLSYSGLLQLAQDRVSQLPDSLLSEVSVRGTMSVSRHTARIQKLV